MKVVVSNLPRQLTRAELEAGLKGHRKDKAATGGSRRVKGVREGEEGKVPKKTEITTSQVATVRQRRKKDEEISMKREQEVPEVKHDARVDGGLSGEAILAAMSRVSAQRAQTLANAKVKEKGSSKKADVDSDESDEEGGLNPLIFRAEWGNHIQVLRDRLECVKRMM